MHTNYSPILIAFFLVLFPAIAYTNPYDVDYFLKNPKDIEEQLDICSIQVWNAKVSGNLAEVKAAKNNPACIAAKGARKKIKEDKAANAEKEYEMRNAAREQLEEEAKQLAQNNTMDDLKSKQETCDDTPRSVLGRNGSECSKLIRAVAAREKLDREASIASYRNGGGRMTEKERFALLAHHGECQKGYDYDTCNHIQRAQQMDQEAYREAFENDKEAAKAVVEKCKPPFFKALAAAKAIKNPGDRMRAVGIVYNLKDPPFDNPLACKTAGSVLGIFFGVMKLPAEMSVE